VAEAADDELLPATMTAVGTGRRLIARSKDHLRQDLPLDKPLLLMDLIHTRYVS
jgi:hypothetical protein